MILFQTHLVKFNHKIAGQERSKGQGKHAHINEKKCRVIFLLVKNRITITFVSCSCN